MSINQFHRALKNRQQHTELKTLCRATYAELTSDDDRMSNWDPWNG